MEWSGFTIFPPGSLSNSVVTCVWLGVMVSVFFNRRLGWSLSGLVVPGYLVPLVLLQASSAIIIVFQGLLTYVLVRFLSSKGGQLGLWTDFFGRDRFFAILLLSVLVRIVTDLWFLPELFHLTEIWLGWAPESHQNWQSFGLIIVALIANQMWKPGWQRGLIVLGTNLLVTLILVRWIVIPLTNYHIGSLLYLYEDVSGSVLASPKAYIILLSSAWLASRMNLRYGWDYNGILIPSLLALQWYQPGKILVSIIEAVVVLLLSTLILRLPQLQRSDISGSRKVMFFFTLSFVYKWILGWGLYWAMPAVKISDYYGFGYLLPALLALKMHDRNLSAPVIRATVQVSVMAVLFATAVGFGLTRMPNPFAVNMTTAASPAPELTTTDKDVPVIEWLRQNSSSFYSIPTTKPVPLSTRQLEIFREALRLIHDDMYAGAWQNLARVNKLLEACAYHAHLHPDATLIVSPLGGAGWGTCVLRLHADTPMLLSLPFPRESWGLLEACWQLSRVLDARCLLFSGSYQHRLHSEGANLILDTPDFEFASMFGATSTLQIRGFNESLGRKLKIEDQDQVKPQLYISGSIPKGLNMRQLETMIGAYTLRWQRPPFPNPWRDLHSAGFAELILDHDSRRRLFYNQLLPELQPVTERRQQSISGYMRDWLLSGKSLIAAAGSNAYKPPTLGEMILMEQEILNPLFDLLPNAINADDSWSEASNASLRDIHATAAILGYEIIRYQEQNSGNWYVILRENPLHHKRYWGTYIFRVQARTPYAIQVPRPVFEREMFEFGVALFAHSDAQALLIGGAHPDANTDGSADLILQENRHNMFNLVTQTLLRHQDTPTTIVHCRAFGLRPDTPLPESDVLYSFAEGIWLRDEPPGYSHELLHTLADMDLSTQQVMGQKSLTGYEVGGLPQARYLDQARNNHFILLWLSPLTRSSYAQQQQRGQVVAELDISGLKPETLAVENLTSQLSGSGPEPDTHQLLMNIRESLGPYQRWGDVVALNHSVSIAEPLHPRAILDINTKQYFLTFADTSGSIYAIANLQPRHKESSIGFDPIHMSPHEKHQILHKFISGRHSWLIAGEQL